ncbi:MAG: SDR family NAD(P)-dependent oxidoreductase [Rhodocyclales bacterium]|nr:SDR family NAD(P)-dependent oxidoreductase [Rhodocyclales bacterium]
MSDPDKPLAGLSAIKLALMAKQVRQQAEHVLRADPVAIVGMACRVPGGGDSPELFWQLLRDGTDAVREVPADRWDADAWYDSDPSAVGKTVTKWAGFLEQIDGFDAEYFGILPREAERMDPQQRLFLEVAIEALDDAGLTREQLRGSRAGVFIASYHNDYAQLQYSDVDAIDPRTLTGTLHSVLANRLSYFLDLRGPSISIDTACSSSLVATHLACQSLRHGESDIAIAGGVSVIVAPELLVSMSKVGFMAPDGRCKTFDASADGFGRGEGCGIVVLKRLSDAIADGDRVLAVIRGSAVNQDGHSTLLAAPSGPAQQALIEEALAGAQLDAGRIGLMETHGTGTALGDPIEVEAIAATIGRPAAGAGPCLLGSAKANVGHLEAAAGVTGLIKSVLALRHEAVPPQVHFHRLSPHISLQGTRLAVPTSLVPWPKGEVPRCAAISSFGVGGTNAHVIVEEAPSLPGEDAEASRDQLRVLSLSAHSEAALRELAAAWPGFLERTADSAADLCYTATQRRTHHDFRLALVGSSKSEFAARIADYLRDDAAMGFAAGRRPTITGPRVAFVFSGQGPQWYAMGRELMASEPAFRDAIEACDRLLRPWSGWSLVEALAASEAETRVDQTEVAQPALFAVQVALAALWKSWGIAPDAVVGHSIGEIAALHIAGVLTLDQAIRVVWHRGRIMQQATGLGRMASVGLTAEQAGELVRPYGERLSVAAINAPRSVVLSGETEALTAALADLATRGVQHRLLPVQYAFHSAQMAPFQHRLAAELADLRSAPAGIPVYSTVTGALATDLSFDAAYFGRNVREPVRFADAIRAMVDDGHTVFLELGPHPVLGSTIAECLAAQDDAHAAVLASLRRGKPERETMLQACAGLYAAGCIPAWHAFQEDFGNVVSLPPTAWQRKRYWLRPRPAPGRLAGGSGTFLPAAASGHPLLGMRLAAAGIRAHIFEGSSAACPWLEDHRIFGTLVLPGAAVLDIFAAAASAVGGVTPMRLASFTMERPLVLPETGEPAARWQTVVEPAEHDGLRLELFEYQATTSGEEPQWLRIATASAFKADADNVARIAHTEISTVASDRIYERFAGLGVDFGPGFRLLHQVSRGTGSAQAWVELPGDLQTNAGGHVLHPVLLDAALQLCSVAAVAADDAQVPAQVMLPLGADRVLLRPCAAQRLLARALVVESGERSLVASLTLETADGELVAAIEGMRFARADRNAFARHGAVDPWLYQVAWHATPMTAAAADASAQGGWLVLADRSGVGDALVAELSARGGQCLRVYAGSAAERVATDVWTVDPMQRKQFAQILDEAPWRGGGVLRGVIHLWSLDVSRNPAATSDALDEADRVGVASALHLTQALVARDVSVELWWVSQGGQFITGDEPVEALNPRAAGLWGLGGVVAAEHPELPLRRIDLDPADSAGVGATRLAQSLLSGTLPSGLPAREIGLRAGQAWTPQLEAYRAKSNLSSPKLQRLEVLHAGTLDGIGLSPMERTPLKADEVRLRVLAAGLNFRDVLLALGMYPGGGVPLGAECAGVVIELGAGVSEFAVGDEVFGFVPASMASEANVPAAFLARVPRQLSIEDAAALPVAFLTAHYGLHSLARLQRGERVLIHAATGGVGLAAVQLAQRCGAEIFATAGSDEKRALLRSLGVAHVMDSRTLDFADQIAAVTAGQGVHVVLNSLAGDFIAASLRALGSHGRFLELGKRDILTPQALAQLRPDVSYHVYDLGSEAQAHRGLLRPMFDDLLGALADGSLRALPVKVFALDEAQDAFRYMAQARHVGKIVLRMPAAGAQARRLVSADATYLVTGGLGALGLQTARWLVERGARHLVLTGRRAPDAAAAQVVANLVSEGVAVRVVQADIADRAQVQALLAEIGRSMPPLRGLIHAAGVVHDAVLMNQHWADARNVMRSKAHGAWVLHEATRDLALDFFVMYSAAGVLLGARGQGVYPAANAELDALAHWRRRLGLPALSVAWGAWAGAGMAGQAAAQGQDQWAERGLRKIEPGQGFARLETLMHDGAICAAVLPIDWQRFLARLPEGMDRSFYAAVAPRGATARGEAAATPMATVAARLKALPAGERRDALMRHLSERALHVLGLEATMVVDPRAPLKDIGLDSLMAVELRNALTRSTGQSLPATLLFDYPTLDALTDHLVRTLGLESAPAMPNKAAAAAVEVARSADRRKTELAALSDEDAEALLLAELGDATTGKMP